MKQKPMEFHNQQVCERNSYHLLHQLKIGNIGNTEKNNEQVRSLENIDLCQTLSKTFRKSKANSNGFTKAPEKG